MPRMMHGFSLVEMMAVLALMAMLTGAVMFLLFDRMSSHTLNSIVNQIHFVDTTARNHCNQTGSTMAIRIDPAKNRVSITDKNRPDIAICAFDLPEPFQLDRVIIQFNPGRSDQFDIEVSSKGITRSYAYRLLTPGGSVQWAIVTGTTGQTVIVDDEYHVNEIMQAISSRRPDTR